MHGSSFTPFPLDTKSFWPRSDFSAKCFVQEACSSIRPAIQWSFYHSTQILPSSLPKLTLLTTAWKMCTPNTMACWNHVLLYHTEVHELAQKSIVQDHGSFPLYALRCFHVPPETEKQLECRPIPHAISILCNSKWCRNISDVIGFHQLTVVYH